MTPRVFRQTQFGTPRATTEHMPFPGHRTCAQWGHVRAGKQQPLNFAPDRNPCPLCGVRDGCKHRRAA